jgi:hypothetical protein
MAADWGHAERRSFRDRGGDTAPEWSAEDDGGMTTEDDPNSTGTVGRVDVGMGADGRDEARDA